MWLNRFPRPSSLVQMAARSGSSSTNTLQDAQLLKADLVEGGSIQRSGKRSRASIFWTVFVQFIGLLWLAPMITLLALNFSSHVIGPSAWCFRGRCSVDSLNGDAIGKAKSLDKADHNTLGALQFVAKALELWFGFVAVNLIYNITMWLASRNDGLPIGLLSASVEFADPRSLIDTFRSAKASPVRANHSGRSTSKFLTWLFVAFLVFMCILANFMGPATAVLVLPTIQWIDTNHHANHTFRGLNIASGPAGDNLFPECTNLSLGLGQYSCNSNSYATSLDSFVDLTIAGDSQALPFVSNGSLPSQEGDVLFTFNSTGEPLWVTWSPSRQVLRELSEDFDNFHTAYTANTDNVPRNNDPQYVPYTQSLQTILKRQGPVLGAYGGYYIPNSSFNVQVGPNQDLRCYDGYTSTVNETDNYQYTKCLPVGTGWSLTNVHANFTIAGSDSLESVQFNVYFTDKAAYYNATWNLGLIPSPCLLENPAKADTQCPWETIFNRRYVPPYLGPVSSNIMTIELTMPGSYPGQSFILEVFTLAGYNSTYTLDTSPSSNPLYLVQLDDIQMPVSAHPQTVVVDPNWFLAAWSVDQNGELAQNRSAAISVLRGFKAAFGNTTFNGTSLGEDLPAANVSSVLANTTTSKQPSAGTGVAGLQKRDSVTNEASATSVTSTQTSAAATFYLVSATDTVANTYATGTNFYAPTTSLSSSAYPTSTLTPDSDEQSEVPVDAFDYYEDDPTDKNFDALLGFLELSYLQALSMVDYSKDDIAQANKTTINPDHPKLHYYATIHVWMYGINSRTSVLGTVVVCIGIVCVICSTVFGLVSRRQRSLTDIIIATIKHQHEGELANMNGNPKHAARLRYKLLDDGADGTIRFHHVD